MPSDRDMLIDRVESSADRLLGMVEGLIEFATQRVGKAAILLGGHRPGPGHAQRGP